jgi:hypothetical protein
MVAGLIPDEVTGNLSSHIMALGLTQPLAEISTRNLPGGKAGLVLKTYNSEQFVSRCLENVSVSTSHSRNTSKELQGFVTVEVAIASK